MEHGASNETFARAEKIDSELARESADERKYTGTRDTLYANLKSIAQVGPCGSERVYPETSNFVPPTSAVIALARIARRRDYIRPESRSRVTRAYTHGEVRAPGDLPYRSSSETIVPRLIRRAPR